MCSRASPVEPIPPEDIRRSRAGFREGGDENGLPWVLMPNLAAWVFAGPGRNAATAEWSSLVILGHCWVPSGGPETAPPEAPAPVSGRVPKSFGGWPRWA